MLVEVIFVDRSPAKCQRKGNLGRSAYLQEASLVNTSTDSASGAVWCLSRRFALGAGTQGKVCG